MIITCILDFNISTNNFEVGYKMVFNLIVTYDNRVLRNTLRNTEDITRGSHPQGILELKKLSLLCTYAPRRLIGDLLHIKYDVLRPCKPRSILNLLTITITKIFLKTKWKMN